MRLLRNRNFHPWSPGTCCESRHSQRNYAITSLRDTTQEKILGLEKRNILLNRGYVKQQQDVFELWLRYASIDFAGFISRPYDYKRSMKASTKFR